MLAEVEVEALPRDQLDEMPDHVRRYGIVPACARRELERQRRELLHQVPRRIALPRRIRHPELTIRCVDVGPLHESIGEPRSVAEEVAYGHGPLGGCRLPGRMIATNEDALIAPR